ncbi:MAG: hypothetical protein WD396_07625, partial [Pseudohongiellaceae bacterium]
RACDSLTLASRIPALTSCCLEGQCLWRPWLFTYWVRKFIPEFSDPRPPISWRRSVVLLVIGGLATR